jgi:hypothetical protein
MSYADNIVSRITWLAKKLNPEYAPKKAVEKRKKPKVIEYRKIEIGEKYVEERKSIKHIEDLEFIEFKSFRRGNKGQIIVFLDEGPGVKYFYNHRYEIEFYNKPDLSITISKSSGKDPRSYLESPRSSKITIAPKLRRASGGLIGKKINLKGTPQFFSAPKARKANFVEKLALEDLGFIHLTICSFSWTSQHIKSSALWRNKKLVLTDVTSEVFCTSTKGLFFYPLTAPARYSAFNLLCKIIVTIRTGIAIIAEKVAASNHPALLI